MNNSSNNYGDLASRTNGNIYIGVVGPVRTGKSTFIKRFMETLVIPSIDDVYMRERARDELPQSGSGKTIMTAEPKFVPEEAVQIGLEEGVFCSVRLVDCVGYMVPGAAGQTEDGKERMVMTPWFDHELTMTQAAELGTRRVIADHSTIGILVTTDGSVCGIDREAYAEPEARAAAELREIGKPFIILLNSATPKAEQTQALAAELSEMYGAACIAVNALELSVEDISQIVRTVLYEFPVSSINVFLPAWADALDASNSIKSDIFTRALTSAEEVSKVRDVGAMISSMDECECVDKAKISEVSFGTGDVFIDVTIPQELYYDTISTESGFEIRNDGDLVKLLSSLSSIKSEYERVHEALLQVRETGYGIVMPTADELRLEEPEIVRQGGRYGVRLKASAPSIHMIKANIETEVSPALGGEKASEEIINFLLQGFDGDVNRIWESNLFGKSMYDIASEGLVTKITRMSGESQSKLQETLQRIINEGSGGLICIIL